MTRLLIALLATLPTFAGCWDQTAYAGGCYQQAVSYGYAVKAAYVAPVVQQYQYYFVGAPIRAEAIVKAEMQASPEYQEFKSYQQFRGEFESFLEWRKQQAAVPPGALPQRQSLIEARCVRCHNPNSPNGPAGGRDFSGSLSVDDLRAIKEILPSGKMPPKSAPEAQGMTNELAGALILEAIDALSAEPQAQPLTEPQPPAEPLDHVPPPPPLPPTEQ